VRKKRDEGRGKESSEQIGGKKKMARVKERKDRKKFTTLL